MSTAPTVTNATQALQMLESALGYLAAADPTQMATEMQARCLQSLERADAVSTAARASVLGGFTVAKGYIEDADYSPRAWLIHKTRITKVPPPVTSPGSAGPALIRGSPRPWPPRR